jgi:hypothetical protein
LLLYGIDRIFTIRVADPHSFHPVRIRIQHYRLNTDPDPGLH